MTTTEIINELRNFTLAELDELFSAVHYEIMDREDELDLEEPEEDYEEPDLDLGFDPYEGCYTYDC